MLRIAPTPIAPHTVASAWPPFLSAGSASPYYEFDGTVTIGRYHGRLQYDRCRGGREPTVRHAVLSDLFTPRHGSEGQSGAGQLYQIRAVAIVQTPRGLLRRVFDKLFHGISLDGTRALTARELKAFLHLEQGIKEAREEIGKPDGAAPDGDEAIAPDEARGALMPERLHQLNDWIALYKSPREAEDRVRELLRRHDPERWPQIAGLLMMPSVAQSVWKDRRLLGWVIDQCPDHNALYGLASTCDPSRGDPRPGLRVMMDDHHLMETYVLPLLHNTIEPMSLLDATDALAPFRSLSTADDAQLFWKDSHAGASRSHGLWLELLGKAATMDQLVDLATFHPDMPHARFIEMALAQMGARQHVGYVDTVDRIVNEALLALDPSDPENRSRSLELGQLRRLVEQTLPAFLAGAQPTRESIPRRMGEKRIALLSYGTRIPDTLALARRHFGHVIQFGRLVACTPCWRWDMPD